jgi:hypothetical protein
MAAPGPASVPVRLVIPTVGVATPLVRLGLEPDGAMQVPVDFATAGWFAGGPAPGQLGPAVIAGHVDSRTGPAVFYRLRDLRPGHTIMVERADGTDRGRVRSGPVGRAAADHLHRGLRPGPGQLPRQPGRVRPPGRLSRVGSGGMNQG